MVVLKDCIVKASEIGATSLALPAVGMGVKGYPSKRVAEVTLQAVKSFTDENPDSALTMIKLYLHRPSLKPSQILVGLNFKFASNDGSIAKINTTKTLIPVLYNVCNQHFLFETFSGATLIRKEFP